MKSGKKQSNIKIILVLAIIILINIISVRVFTRLDLTDQRLYTLTDASRRLVGSLDDKLTVKAYFTKDLPAPYNNNHRHLLDMLNEYKAYSKGNLQYEFIDPVGEEGEAEARKNQIPPVEIQVYNDDKLEVKKAYLGLVMLYEDRKEVIPVIQRLSTLEYDLSSSIKKLTQKSRKTIGYTQGQQELDPNRIQNAMQMLSRQYSLQPVDLNSGNPIDKSITALLIIDPKTQFNDTAKYALDQYLMNGGKLAIFSGNIKVDPTQQPLVGRIAMLGLDDMLAGWGIRVNMDLVQDAQCAQIAVEQVQGNISFQSQVQFPYIPRITNFNEKNPIVKDLSEVIFPFTSSVDTSLARSKGIHPEVIMTTSEMSGRQTGQVMINPFQRYTREDFVERSIPLAAIFEGKFKSFFEGKTPAPQSTISPETMVVIVGSGLFFDDNFTRNRDNMTLFANTIDYLADDAGLITIRSKNVNIPPLEQVSDGTRKFIKYGNIIVPPILVAIIGILRWRRKVAVKRQFESRI